MKERPVLFSGEMVRAILAGRKSQTRRPIVLPRWARGREVEIDEHGMAVVFDPEQETHAWIRCPFAEIVFGEWYPIRPRYELGTRLWVRETWKRIPDAKPSGYFTNPKWKGRVAFYRADNDCPMWCNGPWRPSIHMPRWASRLTLDVTGVRVERLQEISEEDAEAEGVAESIVLPGDRGSFVQSFAYLWEKINGKKHPWQSNPWVWVIEFRRTAR